MVTDENQATGKPSAKAQARSTDAKQKAKQERGPRRRADRTEASGASNSAREAPAMNPREWVLLLVENAQALRDAGVKYVGVGDYEAEIAPEIAEIPSLGDQTHDDSDPLSDPATFGGYLPTMTPVPYRGRK